jgi:N12 class adenine-specific DNA methylase
VRANLAALRTIRSLHAEDRPATPAERTVLDRWTSWGAVPEVFDTQMPEHAAFDWALEDLHALLTPEGFSAAQRTILNAHYTDPGYTETIWDAVARLGFRQGLVLEPGSGSGNFIASAPEGAAVVGVELDPTTAAISQALHPSADIRAESFADTRLPDGTFDLVIGNVPFGNFKLHDTRHNVGKHSIHNHFIIKGLHLAKPGALVAVVTSSYTLDSQNPSARREMALLADLVGAVRLPSAAHQRTAGTKVVTDVLILRRREEDRLVDDTAWERTRRVTIDGVTVPVNEYFIEHPDMVLGTFAIGGQNAREQLTVVGDPDAGPALRTALDSVVTHGLDTGLTHSAVALDPQARPVAFVPAGSNMTEGFLALSDDGVITRVEQGVIVVYEPPATQTSELRTLIRMRDTALELLSAEAASLDDTDEIDRLRAKLNTVYDGYATKYGPINRFTERRTGKFDEKGEPRLARQRPRQGGFRGDPYAVLVAALEDFDPVTQIATKAEMLRQRVVAPRTPRLGADDPADALAICMDTHGRADLDEIARLLGVDPVEARTQLGELVYDEPGTDRLVPAPEYLSGHVRVKLAEARTAAADDPRYVLNVTALTAVIPVDLTPAEIEARLGASWIDAPTVRQFLAETLNDRSIRVDHAGGSMWAVKSTNRQSILATTRWGTHRSPAPDIAQNLLEQRPIRVYDTDPVDGSRTFNADATLAAQAKSAEMSDRFAEWVWEEPARAASLATVYNERFNSLVLRSYDNAQLSLPGLVHKFKPHPHQIAAVARVIAEPSVGLFHAVGAGKTAEMTMAAMELRRLGLVRKPAIVIPNHMMEQFAREFLQLYPRAHLLAASSDDLTTDNRRQFLARATTGDWDAIILTRSAFEKIPLSPQVQQTYRQQEIDAIDRMLNATDSEERLLKRRLEAMRIRAEERLKALQAAKDPGITFEQTGIDYVFVDEAHGYKNLHTPSNVPNMSVDGSNRASDLHMKLQYLRSKYERVATLATGTPIANSMGEAYIMLRYLRPDLFADVGITDFDSFAGTFGSQVTQIEVAPEGGMRMNTRFAKFVNVPELLRMWHVAGDIKMADDLHLSVPDQAARPGDGERAPETVVTAASEELTAFMFWLADRADMVRSRRVDPEVDNLLKITSDGRQAALDLRLLGRSTNEPTKIDAAADKITEIWGANRDHVYQAPDGSDHPTPGGLQIVFADLGTPKPGRWSVYDELRDQLVARGMPREQIRFMHEANTDAQKGELFAAARDGRIAVLIGSTERMGVGTNVQARAIALHHLDCPWRPADLEQREGRILRQGNQNAEVRILRYVTEGSFDGYSWQTVTRKAGFISQVMKGKLDVREIEDIGDSALSYNEVKALATGNPLLLDHAQAQADVARLERLERSHIGGLNGLKHTIRDLTANLTYERQRIADADTALARRIDTRGEQFSMTVDGQTFDSRTEATERLRALVLAQLDDRSTIRRPVEIGALGGFVLTATTWRDSKDVPSINLELLDVPLGTVTGLTEGEVTKVALITRLENRLTAVDHVRATTEADISRHLDDIARAEEQLTQPYRHADALAEARSRLAAVESAIEEQAAPKPPATANGTGEPARSAVGAPQFDVARMLQLSVIGEQEMDRGRIFRDGAVFIEPGSAPTEEIVERIMNGGGTAGEEWSAHLDELVTPEVIARAEQVRAWALALPEVPSAYADDLALAAKADTVPAHRIALLKAAVNGCRAAEWQIERDQATTASRWQGKVNDRVTAAVRVLWLHHNSAGNDSDQSRSVTVQAVDTEGDLYIWRSPNGLDAGIGHTLTITGTVQAHAQWHDRPETRLTDCSCILHAAPRPQQQPETDATTTAEPDAPRPPAEDNLDDPPTPSADAAFAPFSIREQALIRQTVEDHAAEYDPDDVYNGLLDDFLHHLSTAYGNGVVNEAVARYLQAHPEIMQAGPLDDAQLAARRETRHNLGDRYAAEAFAAFTAGDHGRALGIVEEGERACPEDRPGKTTWAAVRNRIERAAPSASGTPQHPVGQAFPALSHVVARAGPSTSTTIAPAATAHVATDQRSGSRRH